MNNEERKYFWKILCSFDGNNIGDECKKLIDAIKYPSYLYRFRTVSSNSLDALRLNKLFFSSADYYDDPFDSYFYINWSSVFDEIIRSLKNKQEKQTAFGILQKMFGISMEQTTEFFDNHSNKEFCEIGKKIIENTRRYIQQNSMSICFTEEGLNETLWLKYADNHHGFVMEYDLNDDSQFLCGKMDRCSLCKAANINYPIYPIYYSNEEYDATEYVKATIRKQIIDLFPLALQKSLINKLPNMTWQREKISLIKKECHMYDKEWRMVYPNDYDMGRSKDRPFILWRPRSITMGIKTGQSSKNLIVSCAKEAGISYVYQCFINNNDELDRRIVYKR